MDKSSKHKINRETVALNDTLDQMDSTDIFRTFHPKTAEYTFFSSAQRTFSKINYILGHNTGLNQFKKIEVLSCTFSDHKITKLEVNHKKNSGKTTNTWRLNNMLLNNKWVKRT